MSTNISKQKREDLLAKIKEIRNFISAASQNENTGNLLSYLAELEKDMNGKKYGLVFEEHREEIDEILDTHTPVLTEEKDLFINNGGQINFLIEGDNLASLKLLEKTHKGKIDLIYIDPPYNRGINDFKYDDDFIVKTDGYIHSKWLSFIKERLVIARRLLADTGAIFISIDDNEQANLKLLCDLIFSENNFAGMIPWRKRTAKTDVPFGISQDYEWILIYAKSNQFNAFTKRENQRKYFSTEDIPGREWRTHDLTTQRTAAERPNSAFTLINPKNGKEYPVNPNRVWAVTKDTLPQYLKEDRIIFPGDYDFLKISKPQMRYFRDEDEAKAIKKTGNVAGVSATTTQLPCEVGMTKEGTADLGELFSGKVFPYPKPVELIKYLIQIGTVNKESALVLDFFAGSGTTAQALLRINAQNKNSNRRFILCTNNENKICHDVTYERIKRVIEKENYAASLKYYKVDYVPISDRLYYEYADELLKYIRELVELENGINFTGNMEIGIVLTDEELDDFIQQLESNTRYKKLYLGHDILMDAQQAQILKGRKITINIIPDYYYKELEG
ncbi:MAG: site-specific DNA-methyltransferase [Lachnospiraceae bacterium]|nr:site-specific DNA-methyltransferase [Dorea sp.]MCI9136396.1 site-specific DNA-methyltransferase [Lachnospiraceae bacterium]